MWFTGTVDSTSGRLVEETTATWFIPEHVEFFDGCEQDIGDLSIVIHDTPAASSGSGAKMLCVDLEIEDQTKGVKGYANIPTGEDDEPKLKSSTPRADILPVATSFKRTGVAAVTTWTGGPRGRRVAAPPRLRRG